MKKFDQRTVIAFMLAVLVLFLMKRDSNYVNEYNNYVNMGSLSQQYIAAHPNRRVSDFFSTHAPGE